MTTRTAAPTNTAGLGTVTSVSVTTANGVSGTVATATTTPAISLTLGAITPSSVNGNTITTGTGTLTLGAGSSLLTSATNSITLTSTAATNVTLPTTGTLGTLAGTETLTNKRITPRIGTVADAATITPTGDSSDQYNVTALAQGATIAAPSGTPTNGQKLLLRFKDDGSNRALTWTTGSSGTFRAIGITLPTTTTASKTMYVGCVYNSADSRWDVIATAQEA